ncbi:hypothetical protein D3C80_1906680 [compost metagenome]
MRNVAVGHDQAVVPDLGMHFVCSPFIDGYTFTDGSMVTDNSQGILTIIFQILWYCRDYCARKNTAVLTYSGTFHNCYIRGYPGSVSDLYILMNGRKRINSYIFSDFSFRMNVC